MADLLIRNVPPKTVEALKKRARIQKRSLQQELLNLLERNVDYGDNTRAYEIAQKIKSKLTVSGRNFSDSVDMIREDRER